MKRLIPALALAALISATCAVSAQDETPKKGRGKFDPAKMAEAAFTKMDANADGKVSKDEYKTWADELAARMKERGGKGGLGKNLADPEKRFADADTDKDGFLSKEEAAKSFGRGFGDRGKGGKGKRPEGGDKKPEGDKKPDPA